MHVVVLGCGRIGAQLAVDLDSRGVSVSIVDRDRRALRQRLPERFTGRAVLGAGIDRDVLEQAGIEEAEALAAVMYGDNSNIVAARIARETYEVSNVVARIKDPRRAAIYQRLGIPTVATVTWTTDQVMRRLFPDDTVVDWDHPTGELRMVERDLPDAWAGKALDSLDKPDAFRLVAVTRAGSPRLVSPSMIAEEGDVLHVLVHRNAADDLEQLLAAGPGGR